MFEPTVKHESKVAPGVTFTVRRLNKIQRAKRDFPLIDHRVRITELSADLDAQPNPDLQIQKIGEAAVRDKRKLTEQETDQIAAIEKAPETAKARLARAKLRHEMDIIHHMHIIPAYVRAGLVSIEGLPASIPATTDGILESAEDGLLDEITAACEQASGLTVGQQKNSSSPSGSSEAPAGGEMSTSAEPAEPKA